jgi:hypothetical protein
MDVRRDTSLIAKGRCNFLSKLKDPILSGTSDIVLSPTIRAVKLLKLLMEDGKDGIPLPKVKFSKTGKWQLPSQPGNKR